MICENLKGRIVILEFITSARPKEWRKSLSR